MTTQLGNYKRTKFSCFFSYLAMASIFALPPMLFVTFRETYGISYTLLGTLVLINFCTQLTVDLMFTFFSKFFNIKIMVRFMPILTSVGMALYALIPSLFPQYAYAGLVAGTIIFSVSAGLSEVLLSPLVAALPSDNPERDMSALHSLYGYGVVTVVLISSLFFRLFGTENWMYLTLFFAVLPLFSALSFMLSPIPCIQTSNRETSAHKNTNIGFGLALCVLCIFLGSAAENTMTNWISSYVENALHISKSLSDLLGLSLFAIALSLTRTFYAKYGRNISKMLLIGMIGATCCYLVAGLCSNMVLALVACVLTGMFTSMLWPGSLILMEEQYPQLGVAAYAMMAAGGDFGASVAPQMLGAVADAVSVSDWAVTLSTSMSISAEQLGMKVAMVISSLFPFLGIFVILYIIRYFRKHKTQ